MDNLDLIDWRMVAFSFLWILGAAILLAAAGFAYDRSRREERRFKQVFADPPYDLAVNLGLLLFSIGMLGMESALWESIIWGLLSSAFLYFTLQSIKRLDGRD